MGRDSILGELRRQLLEAAARLDADDPWFEACVQIAEEVEVTLSRGVT